MVVARIDAALESRVMDASNKVRYFENEAGGI